MKRILVVDDSTESQDLVERSLQGAFELRRARSLSEAELLISTSSFDLVILDLNLPDGDGLQLCSVLCTRDEDEQTPIIVSSSRNTTTDKVAAFTVGADDYVSKPIQPEEFKARVEAKLRRKKLEPSPAEATIQLGELEIDQVSQRVRVHTGHETEELSLTALELRILMFLSRMRNKVVTRNDILDEVWGQNVHVFARNVDTHVSKLRRKLGRLGGYLQSAHGKGYCFAPPDSKARPELPIGSGAS